MDRKKYEKDSREGQSSRDLDVFKKSSNIIQRKGIWATMDQKDIKAIENFETFHYRISKYSSSYYYKAELTAYERDSLDWTRKLVSKEKEIAEARLEGDKSAWLGVRADRTEMPVDKQAVEDLFKKIDESRLEAYLKQYPFVEKEYYNVWVPDDVARMTEHTEYFYCLRYNSGLLNNEIANAKTSEDHTQILKSLLEWKTCPSEHLNLNRIMANGMLKEREKNCQSYSTTDGQTWTSPPWVDEGESSTATSR